MLSFMALVNSSPMLEKGSIISSNCPLLSISDISGVVKYMMMDLRIFQQALMNDNTKRMVIPVGRFCSVVSILYLVFVGLSHCGSRFCFYERQPWYDSPTNQLFILQIIKSQRVVLHELNALGNLGVHHLVNANEFHLFAVFGNELLNDG